MALHKLPLERLFDATVVCCSGTITVPASDVFEVRVFEEEGQRSDHRSVLERLRRRRTVASRQEHLRQSAADATIPRPTPGRGHTLPTSLSIHVQLFPSPPVVAPGADCAESDQAPDAGHARQAGADDADPETSSQSGSSEGPRSGDDDGAVDPEKVVDGGGGTTTEAAAEGDADVVGGVRTQVSDRVRPHVRLDCELESGSGIIGGRRFRRRATDDPVVVGRVVDASPGHGDRGRSDLENQDGR